jgi:hypothetical protein
VTKKLVFGFASFVARSLKSARSAVLAAICEKTDTVSPEVADVGRRSAL